MPGSESQARKIRFGPYELDEAARELRKNGLSIHLQDQPWEVLRALLERPGEVVSREDLRRRLWPDGTFVDYEQSLNKAVNKLREALCDSADRPRYVETVSRRGYRFVAAVELETPKTEEPQEKPSEISKPARSRGRFWWGAAAIGLVVAGALVTGLWPVGEITARVTPLTNGGNVRSDRLAVHDGRILYLAGAAKPWGFASEIWSVSANGGDQKRETLPFLDAGDDVWFAQVNSRQGDILVASHPSGVTRGILWLTDFNRSKPRQIGEWIEGYIYALSPDLKSLLKSGKDGLFVRSADSGRETPVVRSDWNAYYYFFWHPSGERIGFVPVKGGVASAWEVKPDGSGMRPLLPEFRGAQWAANWSPDGRRLYFVSQGEIYRRGKRGWLGWMRSPTTQRLTTGSTIYGLAFEDPADPRLIYSRGRVPRGESMKLNRHTNRFERYLDGLSASWLDYSHDGLWIAYVSYPGAELWKCRRDGSGKVLLDDSLLSYHPRWSPDDKHLAFAAIRKGNVNAFRIYTIAAEGGKPEPVKGVKGFAHDPNWSPDGKRLVFSPVDYPLIEKQDRHMSIVNVDTGEVEMVPGSEDICCQGWSPDGKHLVGLTWSPEHLVAYDFETKQWTVVNDKAVGYFAWSKDSKYLYGMMEAQILVRIELTTRKVEEIRRIDDFSLTGVFFAGASWTPELDPIILADKSTIEIYRIEVER